MVHSFNTSVMYIYGMRIPKCHIHVILMTLQYNGTTYTVKSLFSAAVQRPICNCSASSVGPVPSLASNVAPSVQCRVQRPVRFPASSVGRASIRVQYSVQRPVQGSVHRLVSISIFLTVLEEPARKEYDSVKFKRSQSRLARVSLSGKYKATSPG